MGDKSPKSKQREKHQKDVVKAQVKQKKAADIASKSKA
jgi:hypothetical protein